MSADTRLEGLGVNGPGEVDEPAFEGLTAQHRRELHVHCYRMIGSFEEAEDLVQETLLRAWRRRDTLERDELFRAWLYRRSEEHTSELQSRQYLVCRLLLEKKKTTISRRAKTTQTSIQLVIITVTTRTIPCSLSR